MTLKNYKSNNNNFFIYLFKFAQENKQNTINYYEEKFFEK